MTAKSTSRWQWDDEENRDLDPTGDAIWPRYKRRSARRLSPVEERDILETPLPVKSPRTERTELKTRRDRADTAIRPEDQRPAPLRLHDRGLDDAGAPAPAEAFILYLSGERGRNERDTRVALLLRELEGSHPIVVAVLRLKFEDGWSDTRIAGGMFLTHKTVGRMVQQGLLYMAGRYQELYHDAP